MVSKVEGYIVAFTVYLDDSGTDPSQAVACATALIVPAKRILAMETEFKRLRDQEQFSDFHASDCVNRNHTSEFSDWSKPKVARVIRRVRDITKKYGCQVFSFAVQKRIYESIVPDQMRCYAGQYHYSWALRHVLRFAQVWRHERRISEPYEWLFDWMEKRDKTRKEIEDVMAQAEEEASQNGMAGEFKHFDFRPRKTLAGLQCVDLIAWTNYNFAMSRELNRSLGAHAEHTWESFATMPKHPSAIDRSGRLDWNHAVFIKAAHLKDWAQRETADGTSILRFKAWEERKKARIKRHRSGV